MEVRREGGGERERAASGGDMEARGPTSARRCVAAAHWPTACVTLLPTANQSREQETCAPQGQWKPERTPLQKSGK